MEIRIVEVWNFIGSYRTWGAVKEWARAILQMRNGPVAMPGGEREVVRPARLERATIRLEGQIVKVVFVHVLPSQNKFFLTVCHLRCHLVSNASNGQGNPEAPVSATSGPHRERRKPIPRHHFFKSGRD